MFLTDIAGENSPFGVNGNNGHIVIKDCTNIYMKYY